MQRHIFSVIGRNLVAMLTLVCSAGISYGVDNTVCSAGLGEPPFLSYGVDANLLLLIDNSGSMLDMAYVDENKQCFDKTFDSSQSYAGNFNRLIPVDLPAEPTETAWYKWVDGIASWQHATYSVGDLVAANGQIYRAVSVSGSPSTGDNIYEDTAVNWERLLQPTWRAGTTYRKGAIVAGPATDYLYHATIPISYSTISPDVWWNTDWKIITTWTAKYYAKGTYVLWKNIIYRSTTAGTSNGDSPLDDSGVRWEVIDPLGWIATDADDVNQSVTYNAGEIVTYRGMVYQAKQTHTVASNVQTLYEDSFSTNWKRIDEGHFEMITAASAATQCSKSASDAYYSNDFCAQIDTVSNPNRMTTFVATGNMLNWLMSSKFDIQKNILTGGKYNSNEQLLISESRGCSGSRFVKEITLTKPLNYKLTMAVRGPKNEGESMRDDRVDSFDDTARVEILGVTSVGYDADGQCQAVIEKYEATGEIAQGDQSLVYGCLTKIGDSTSSHPALNHAMQYCWMDKTRNLTTVIKDCSDLYDSGTLPSELNDQSGLTAYQCYGMHNASKLHTQRTGYMGRCWATPGCSSAYINTPATASYDKLGWKWSSGGVTFLNQSGVSYTQYCSKFAGGTCKEWSPYTVDLTGQPCTPTSGSWSSDIDGTPGISSGGDTVSPAFPAGYKIPNNYYGLNDEQSLSCVYWAMEDFCSSLTTPQVIDPSDQGVATIDNPSASIPAQLIDMSVLVQLGVDVPLKVMKGYTQQVTQPSGILQDNADNLRVGAMAFNKVGSAEECAQASTSDSIEQYCLEGNKDGARVISPVRSGTWKYGNGDRHVDIVADAVNQVQAIAWTPLAEAMYNAIGYYTQNRNLRLSGVNDPSDFQTDEDVVSAWHNNKAYLTGTYVIDAVSNKVWQAVSSGTSSGSRLEYDTGVQWTAIGPYSGIWSNGTNYSANDIVRYTYSYTSETTGTTVSKTRLYIAAGSGTAQLDAEAISSGKHFGPLSDKGIYWEPLIDPVLYSCQQNHILVITEGSSTADINSQVKAFIDTNTSKGITDPTNSTEGECTATGLEGSTYLDDLTYFGQSVSHSVLYPAGNEALPLSDYPYDLAEKNKLTTHFVITGSSSEPTNTTNECDPVVLMRNAAANGGTETPLYGESPEKLEGALMEIFNELRQRASAGSAASVISSARSGEGAIYQAIFWPELVRYDTDGKEYSVAWAGDVHGLFLDDNGYMYEDTDQDRQYKVGVDKRVIVYFDEDTKKTRACYDASITLSGNCPSASVAELENVNFLWSASDWLSDYPISSTTGKHVPDTLNTLTNRTTYKSSERGRYIYTWNDDGDGDVEAGEYVPFEESGADWDALAWQFNAADGAEVKKIIRWLRGSNESSYRSRQSVVKVSGLDVPFTWRLGDIIHSTPQTVTSPSEGYHLIYNDQTYTSFVSKYKSRRHVVYFGANDGMLHAVNAGFYSDIEKKFCLNGVAANGSCLAGESNQPALGAELWAYVPYNLHPHLKCLTDENYKHKYYVDLKPRVFDVKVFTPDSDHPNGWGTILVSGMRFGGAPVTMKKGVAGPDGILGTADDSYITYPFVSSYSIFDITNPEKPPVLLGEMTRANDGSSVDLGYSTVIPTMVIAKNDTNNKWYLVFGSGPHGADALKGVSDQQAKVSVISLNDLVANKVMRIPSTELSSKTFTLGADSFVSDPITIDFDINPSASGQYASDAVYFGTVEGNFGTCANGKMCWQGGGHLYRMVMNSGGHSIGIDDIVDPNSWAIAPLIDLSTSAKTGAGYGQPITAAPSVGTDGYNYWVYFGTGRFFDADDKADSTQQSYYGIKEPMVMKTDTDGTTRKMFTWNEVAISGTLDATNGVKGKLQKVDKIKVVGSRTSTTPIVCNDTSGNCPPSAVSTFGELEAYIAGSGDCTSSSYNNCVDGWYKWFSPYENRERNIGQATLLGGLVTFTTYQPYNDVCQAEGNSYLYAVYYKTGTSWYENVFGGSYGIEDGYILNKLNLGRGLTTTPSLFVGSGDASGKIKAFVQTSTGAIREITQENVPVPDYKSGRMRWREYQRP